MDLPYLAWDTVALKLLYVVAHITPGNSPSRTAAKGVLAAVATLVAGDALSTDSKGDCIRALEQLGIVHGCGGGTFICSAYDRAPQHPVLPDAEADVRRDPPPPLPFHCTCCAADEEVLWLQLPR